MCTVYSRAWCTVAASVWRIAEESSSYSYSALLQVWDEELAATAQAYAEECHFGPNPSVTTSSGVRRGENLGFTANSTVREATEEVVRGWQQAQDASYTQVSIAHGALSVGQEVVLCMMAGGSTSTVHDGMVHQIISS